MFDSNTSKSTKRAIVALVLCAIVLLIVTAFVGARYVLNNHQSNKQYDKALNQSLEAYHMVDNPEEKFPSAINLAHLYTQRDDYENAIKYLKVADEYAGGNDPNIHSAIASNAIKLGNKETAIDYLEKATATYQKQLPEEAYKRIKSANDAEIAKLLAK